MNTKQQKNEEKAMAAELLEEARKLMNNRGKHWAKGYFEGIERDKKTGERYTMYCSIGAIDKVTYDPKSDLPMDYAKRHNARNYAIQALREAIKEYTGTQQRIEPRRAVIRFNDKAETKWGDVSKVFRKAAASLRREAKKG